MQKTSPKDRKKIKVSRMRGTVRFNVGKCLKDQLWISITYYRLISINNHNLCNSLEFNEMSLENNTSHWLQAHNYSSGESCDSFKTFLNEQQYILKQDVRALAGKWIVVILAVFHLLKECFQLANVSTKILSTYNFKF